MTEFHPFHMSLDGAPSELKALLGGKGAGLMRMTSLGIPVPPGFVLSTETCRHYLASGWDPAFETAIRNGLADMAARLGRELGDPANPLVVSVRSGAAESMPGMMDTLLNVGMNPTVAAALSASADDPAFGWETAHRFIRTWAELVHNAPDAMIQELATPADPSAETVAAATARMAAHGIVIPEDPTMQVVEAVKAVFASWNSPRAETYRERQGIGANLGTAAVIQAMVFGNRGETSGTGVAFSRNPSTGEPGLMGDFLRNAQGEDVVAGTHATQPLAEMSVLWPEVGAQLHSVAATLEHEYQDMVDIEFTVEEGTLWLLQCRNGKRTAHAALRAAVDMANDSEFPLSRSEAVARVGSLLDDPPMMRVEPEPHGGAEPDPFVSGLGASPGVAVGVVSIDVEDTVQRAAAGESVILIRPTTSPADVHGMAEAAGFVTTTGGMVSHAALVAREWGLPAVVGVAELRITDSGIANAVQPIPVGTTITVDGDRGVVLLGAHEVQTREPAEVAVLRSWRTDDGAGESPAAAPAPLTGGATGGPASKIDVLRVISIKGMATTDAVADLLGSDAASVGTAIAELTAEEMLQGLPGDRVRLTKEGSEAGLALYAEEAGTVAAGLEPSMPEFHELNDAFKELITNWQMREVDGQTVPNDHSDAAYDDAIFDRLDTIDGSIQSIVEAVSATVPRLGRYTSRFTAALAAVRAGDPQMMAHPLKDSYHTVWFELHEELIRLTNRTRTE